MPNLGLGIGLVDQAERVAVTGLFEDRVALAAALVIAIVSVVAAIVSLGKMGPAAFKPIAHLLVSEDPTLRSAWMAEFRDWWGGLAKIEEHLANGP